TEILRHAIGEVDADGRVVLYPGERTPGGDARSREALDVDRRVLLEDLRWNPSIESVEVFAKRANVRVTQPRVVEARVLSGGGPDSQRVVVRLRDPVVALHKSGVDAEVELGRDVRLQIRAHVHELKCRRVHPLIADVDVQRIEPPLG